MSIRSKTATAAALALLVTGCGSNGTAMSPTPGTSTGAFAFPATSETLSKDAQLFISPDEICDTLSPEDMAPLTDGEVTDTPSPTTNLGLPGCKWPVSNGYGWLDLAVFKPVSIDALVTIATERYQVGAGTVHQSSPDSIGSCFGIIEAPGAPPGFVLGFSLDGVPRKTSENPDLCQLAIPQTVKVLERLGW